MMGSSEARGVVRKRFDENISVNDCSAACVCPTETRPSACFRMVSGFVIGAIFAGFYTVTETLLGIRKRQGDAEVGRTYRDKTVAEEARLSEMVSVERLQKATTPAYICAARRGALCARDDKWLWSKCAERHGRIENG
jgi:hypothetical protein